MALGFLCVFTLNHSSSRYIFHELHLITLLVWLSRHNLMQDLKRQLLLVFSLLSSSSCAFMAVVLSPEDVRQRLEINATRSKTVFFLFVSVVKMLNSKNERKTLACHCYKHENNNVTELFFFF